jgi:thioredoxin reductase (NADPH)
MGSRRLAVDMSTGVDWHRIEVPGLDRLLGRGVLYGASRHEAHCVVGKRVFVVGGGNSVRAHADVVTGFLTADVPQ